MHEAQIQQTKQEADNEWVKWHLCPSERHLCPRFEALETGQTEAEVMEATFQKPMEHKKIRVQRFKEVLNKNTQEWEALGSLGEKRKFLRSKLEEMFTPLMEYIELKRNALAIVAKDVEAHNALVQKLKESSSLQEDEELDEGHGLVEGDDKYIAFASKGKAQHSYIPASSYQDEWVSSKDRTCSCSGSLQRACCTLCQLWEYLFGDLMVGFR